MIRTSSNRKASVDLAPPPVRVSRIRRDPVPAAPIVTAAEVREREALTMVAGVIVLTLALIAILVGIGNADLSPREVTVVIGDRV